MKQFIRTFIFLFFSYPLYSQSLAIADNWFDKYEYEDAAISYEKITDRTKLSSEDYQRWCYSYFASGNYEKCFALSDSLVKDKNTPAFFLYTHAYSAMALGKYSLAKQSFESYKKMDDDYLVDSLIVSCQQIPTWKEESYVQLKLDDNNTTKSDFVGNIHQEDVTYFHEKGKDSTGVTFIEGDLRNSELLLMRPEIYSKGNVIAYTLPDNMENYNLTSLAVDNQSKDVFVTLNNPIDQNELFKSPHIYKGVLNENSIEQLVLWEYAGLEDSTSTAYATINQSGNLLVYSKDGVGTQGADLYISRKINGLWEKPEPLIELNTDQDEVFPIFMGDTVLSFSSNGRVGYGGLDIYLAKIDTKANISHLQHLKAPVNGFSDDFNFIYYSGADSALYSSNRIGGKGDDDVYFIKFNDKVQPKEDSTDYYNFINTWTDIIVYFDFDKFSLEAENLKKIENLKNFLSKYDNVKLIIEGHTDNRGTDQYNQLLSENRSNTVKDVLIESGIDSSKIITVSKGKYDPAIDCTNGCTEAQHKLNRFASVKLVK